jgi:hypothetical protein
MRFSGPYVIVTQSSESAQCRLDLHLFQAGKLHTCRMSLIPHALPRQRNAAPLLNLGARQCLRCSSTNKSITLAVNQIYQRGARCQIWNSLPPRLIIDRGFPDPATAFLQLRSKIKIWNNANNWGNIICKQKNKRKKCSKQLTKYPFNENIKYKCWFNVVSLKKRVKTNINWFTQ